MPVSTFSVRLASLLPYYVARLRSPQYQSKIPHVVRPNVCEHFGVFPMAKGILQPPWSTIDSICQVTSSYLTISFVIVPFRYWILGVEGIRVSICLLIDYVGDEIFWRVSYADASAQSKRIVFEGDLTSACSWGPERMKMEDDTFTKYTSSLRRDFAVRLNIDQVSKIRDQTIFV